MILCSGMAYIALISATISARRVTAGGSSGEQGRKSITAVTLKGEISTARLGTFARKAVARRADTSLSAPFVQE